MKNPLKIFPGTVGPPTRIRDPVDELRHPEEAKKHFVRYIRDEVLVLNFYRTHMLYFIIVILICSVIAYGEGLANDSDEISGGSLRYIDSLFLCCSAMTTTGLNTVNLGDITAFQQAVLAVLLVVGNVTFVSTFVVLIRRHFFRRKLADMVNQSRTARRAIRDIEEQEHEHTRNKKKNKLPAGLDSIQQAPGRPTSQIARRRTTAAAEAKVEMVTQRRASRHHQTGLGAFPAPWEIYSVRRFVSFPFRKLASDWRQKTPSYLSFDAKLDRRGRFRALNELERCELGGVEYRALGALIYILTAYQIFWIALGTALLVPYSYRSEIVEILHSEQPGNLNPGWFAFFSVITGYCNGGLNLLNANFIPLYKSYFILIVEGALTVAGNTQFPILLRLLIWTMSKLVSKHSSFGQTLQFLLHHPRRCFIYLFPSKETWYLFIIQVFIDLTMWILFEILNIGLPAVQSIPSNIRVFDGLFQATGLRTSGAYIITISSLAPALLVAYLIAMFISSFPIVMALRQTNTYEERSIGLDKGDSSGGLGLHLKRQLAYDIWFQMFAWFLICIVERNKIINNQDGFTVFALLFEVTSAYGTVGLSTGVSYDKYSLSGAFQSLSKVIMLAVMLRGRHRGLPLAIDRSILLPGEELMHKMDQEYNEIGLELQGEGEEGSGEENTDDYGTSEAENTKQAVNSRNDLEQIKLE